MHKTASDKALAALEKRKKGSKKTKKGRKVGRNKRKCELYRMRVGKPNGPGQSGNKAGKKN